MRLNVDSDSVVYDLNAELVSRAKRFFGEDYPTPTHWSLAESWGITEAESRLFFEEETAYGLYRYGHAIEGAREGLHYLAGQGHDIRIVTHKHAMAWATSTAMIDTVAWYGSQGLLDIVDLVFARGDKTTYPADVVIDDKPNCAWAQLGALNLLYAQPWNRDVDYRFRMAGVENWEQVIYCVERETKRREAQW